MVQVNWSEIEWQHIQTHLDGRILTITLSRPKERNSWTEIMRNEIIEAVDTANRSEGTGPERDALSLCDGVGPGWDGEFFRHRHPAVVTWAGDRKCSDPFAPWLI